MGSENKLSIPSFTCNYCDIQFNARSKCLAPPVFNAVRIPSDKTQILHPLQSPPEQDDVGSTLYVHSHKGKDDDDLPVTVHEGPQEGGRGIRGTVLTFP